MAHDKCIGIWDMELGGVSDGRVTIDDHSSSTFTGTHHNTGASLTDTHCTGEEMSFARKDGNKKIKYKKGALSSSGGKDFVDGKFETSTENAVTGLEEIEAIQPGESDEWTGEKGGA